MKKEKSMESKKILVPIDFSPVSHDALLTAKKMAIATGFDINLVHIRHIKSAPDVEQRLKLLADETNSSGEVSCGYVLRNGSIFSEISEEAASGKYEFAIIGSHGFKGLREMMFGADILRLLKSFPIPAVVIQHNYQFPEKGFKTILVPVAPHDAFPLLINQTVRFAKLFNSEVHLYSIQKPELIWSQKLLENITIAKQIFDDSGVRYLRVNEPQMAFSLGYSKQTLHYANTAAHADVIAMMSIPAPGHFYFSDEDKENLITNISLIPVISISDKISNIVNAPND